MRRLLALAPPLGPGLWLTLASLPVALLNLLYLAEIWPHTPGAKFALSFIIWLLLLALPLQLVGWGWRWLRACHRQDWVQVLATAGYLGAASLALGAWLLVLAGGPVAWWWLAPS